MNITIYNLKSEEKGDAQVIYAMDEALQACLAEQIGMPISRITIYVSGVE